MHIYRAVFVLLFLTNTASALGIKCVENKIAVDGVITELTLIENVNKKFDVIFHIPAGQSWGSPYPEQTIKLASDLECVFSTTHANLVSCSRKPLPDETVWSVFSTTRIVETIVEPQVTEKGILPTDKSLQYIKTFVKSAELEALDSKSRPREFTTHMFDSAECKQL